MVLQHFYALEAMQESGLHVTSLEIDHSNGKVYINGNERSLTFPKSLLDLCKSTWNPNRTQEYFFRGKYKGLHHRQWIEKYENVDESLYGRNPKLKYKYDVDYYKNLGNTKFGLCPVGDYNWSYRFFETIMCGAIPVLGDDENDIYSHNYKFYRDSDVKQYKQEWAEHNLKALIKESIL